jgi:hypothetical protein
VSYTLARLVVVRLILIRSEGRLELPKLTGKPFKAAVVAFGP